ncbi:succinate-semialdehyde dehydrogenase [Mariprofundus ferrooxydans]|uniref:Aldehyde dehydrogenase family protein n=2 Tax=Mariprofundus ferrooxydans TaxID=314344 RepID=Q0F194_9PROT|nr:aldehyde dehydrogenase family protein [Mariprofundus ferrooxydans PV-1]KON47250.1 succinate-semialdehyde dehydrogenase [Mariprofundus ferrooxydans]
MNGQLIGSYCEDSAEAVESKLTAVYAAQPDWVRQGVEHRAAALLRLAEALEANIEPLARSMVLEMGKPIRQARAEVRKCATLCRYTCQHGPADLLAKQVDLSGRQATVRFDPLGCVLAIMPWNFPYWQTLRLAVPTLLAGNAVLIKPAPNVLGSAEALLELLHQAGIPVIENLRTGNARTASVIADPRIAGVSLTGSRTAGRAVAGLAGRHLKKCVLELGGSDPYLILADADVTLAAERCVAGRFNNTGQTCIAAKRWIVVDAVYDAFRTAVLERMTAMKSGDPMLDNTQLGPMARADLRIALDTQVQQSIAAGARCTLGGVIPDGEGCYYPPTLLEKVRPGMPAFDDELFGPVAALIRAADDEDAVRLANHSRMGLGAAVFSTDAEKALSIAARLEAGNVAINDFVRSDPRLPFGGIKESGYGRELATYGMHEFVNIKTVVSGGLRDA